MLEVFTGSFKQGLKEIAASDETGQGLVEYSLILVFIAIVAVLAVTFLGSNISQAISSIANQL